MRGLGWKDLQDKPATPLAKMGQRAAIHPQSTFVYSQHTDLRKRFAEIREQMEKVTTLRRKA